MIDFYKATNGKMTKLTGLEDNCWISAVAPTSEEIVFLTEKLKVDFGFIQSALDEEESSHIESEDDQTLVIVDVPTVEKPDEKTISYSTMPMGIILTDRFILTVCLKEHQLLREFADGMVRGLNTAMKTRFLLTLLLKVASRFLLYLKQIDKISSLTEKQLHLSMKNKELIQLLGLEKSLVYFSTSLKSNEMTLEKILRGRIIKLYEEDQDLLEDVLIEVKQAIEMCNIYSNILSGTMDAFASIISNNLNIVMKVLTSITIVMAIPTMVFSYYGMNVPLPFADVAWFPLALSLVATVVVALILVKKKMFK